MLLLRWGRLGGKECVDLRREIKSLVLNMLCLRCLLDTEIETLIGQLKTDVWGSGRRYSWRCQAKRPECEGKSLKLQN